MTTTETKTTSPVPPREAAEHSGNGQLASQHRIDPSRISIVIPCFNEAAVVGAALDELVEAMPDAEIIVVDDGSSDDSAAEVEQRPVRLIRHQENRGQGASLKTGCRAASREYVIWYDADGQHQPQMVSQILDVLGQYDCVIGERSRESATDFRRRPGKFVLGMTARILTRQKIRDLNSGLRAFKTSVLNRYLHLLPARFSASTTSTILMLERGYRLGWVPIITPARVGKSSVSQLRDGFSALMVMLHLVQLFKPLRFFLPVSLFLLLGGIAYGMTHALLVGRGIPDAAVLITLAGLQTFFFGLVADQLSAIRKERFENGVDQ